MNEQEQMAEMRQMIKDQAQAIRLLAGTLSDVLKDMEDKRPYFSIDLDVGEIQRLTAAAD